MVVSGTEQLAVANTYFWLQLQNTEDEPKSTTQTRRARSDERSQTSGHELSNVSGERQCNRQFVGAGFRL